MRPARLPESKGQAGAGSFPRTLAATVGSSRDVWSIGCVWPQASHAATTLPRRCGSDSNTTAGKLPWRSASEDMPCMTAVARAAMVGMSASACEGGWVSTAFHFAKSLSLTSSQADTTVPRRARLRSEGCSPRACEMVDAEKLSWCSSLNIFSPV